MYDALPLEVTLQYALLKIPIYRLFLKRVFSDMNLITFTAMT